MCIYIYTPTSWLVDLDHAGALTPEEMSFKNKLASVCLHCPRQIARGGVLMHAVGLQPLLPPPYAPSTDRRRVAAGEGPGFEVYAVGLGPPPHTSFRTHMHSTCCGMRCPRDHNP